MTTKNNRTPGRPKRTEQHPPVNEVILYTAAKLFMEQGYESVSLQEIAKVCGVTKATIYYYFNNKAQLFTTAVTEMLKQAQKHTQRIMSQDAPIYKRLEEVSIIKLKNSHGEFETIMREARSSLSKEQLSAIEQQENAIHEILINHFENAIAAGEIRKCNTLLLSHTFSSLLMLGNREIASPEAMDASTLAGEIMDIFWHGIAP